MSLDLQRQGVRIEKIDVRGKRWAIEVRVMLMN